MATKALIMVMATLPGSLAAISTAAKFMAVGPALTRNNYGKDVIWL